MICSFFGWRWCGFVAAAIFLTGGLPLWAQFEARSTRTIPGESLAMAVGDFNNDGKLDLVVQNGWLEIALGNGDGTFQVPKKYSYLIGASIAVGDFNGDGNLDIVATSYPYSSTIEVFLGNGDGTFQAPITSATTAFPDFVAVGDFNGDHKLDIAIIDSPYVSILLGNGDGTFQAPNDNQSFLGPQDLALGDFNNDHKLDVTVVGYSGGEQGIGILLGNGDGTLQPSLTLPLIYTPATVAVGDFNHDGNLDAAVEDQGVGATVLLGNGAGGFDLTEQYSVVSGFGQIGVGDFNGDGTLDLALAGFTDPAGLSILTGNGDGTFQAAHFYPAGELVQPIALGDFNGDHMLDVALLDRDLGAYTFLNTGVASFSPTSPMNFLAQAINTSSTQTVMLTNAAATALSISSIMASGEFHASNTCGKRIAPKATCPIKVTFLPQKVGGATGLLMIQDGASSKPQMVELLGTATALLLSPSTLNFGRQKVGTQSLPQKISVANESSSVVVLSGIEITGNGSKEFKESNDCGSQLAANAICTISVTFTPTNDGTRSAFVQVSIKSGTSPQAVALTGVGD
jgi:hypothetical protein